MMPGDERYKEACPGCLVLACTQSSQNVNERGALHVTAQKSKKTKAQLDCCEEYHDKALG